MKHVKSLLLGAAALALLAAAGCYRNPSDVAVHKPGVYNGSPDPLIAKLQSPQLNRTLDERAVVAFRDR
ncbi:MAG: hypothetical protein P8Y78_04370 [Acidihalobacter sp.]|jgi:hypothetical protein